MANGRTPRSSSPSPDEGTPRGLPAVLERAEARPSAGRARPRRAVLHSSPAGARRRQVRPVRPPVPAAVPVPVRPATPAPVMWRPAAERHAGRAARPAAAPARPRPPPGPLGRRPGRRPPRLEPARSGGPATERPRARAPEHPAPRVGLAGRLRRGVRRLALWGAGPTVRPPRLERPRPV